MVELKPLLRFGNLLVGVLISLTVLGVYLCSPVITTYDSSWSLHTAMSIIKEGNTNLDEYIHLVNPDLGQVEWVNGHVYYYFPIGSSLVALPFLIVADYLSVPLFGIDDLGIYFISHPPNSPEVIQPIERFIASTVVAATAFFLFLTLRRVLSIKNSVLLTLIFAFCTSAWSVASRGLWQHGPSMLMLTITLYLLHIAQVNPPVSQFAAIPLACSFVIRPTNSVSIAVFSILVLVRYRRYFLRYCLLAALIAVPFLVYNNSVYHAWLPTYYLPQRVGGNPRFYEALAGNLISPARGLFIFSPVFALSIYGTVLGIKKRICPDLTLCILVILLLHWLIISSFRHWWGGWSIGPRFFSDMIPYLVFLLSPVLNAISSLTGLRQWLLAGAMLATSLVSVLIHFRCATDYAVSLWNAIPDDIDRDPSRLWDWHDLQFVRGLKSGRIAVVPENLYLSVQDNTGEEVTGLLEVRNIGHKPVMWEALPPFNVNLVADSNVKISESYVLRGESPIPGLSSVTVPVVVRTAEYDTGVHSLGGILFTDTNNSSIVVPVTLEILDSNRRIQLPEDSLSGLGTYRVYLSIVTLNFVDTAPDVFIPPPDIFINGHPQLSAPGQLRAVYGQGWYSIERAGEAHWRWARSPASVYIYSSKRFSVQARVKLISIYDPAAAHGLGTQGEVSISVNSRPLAKLTVCIQRAFTINIPLRAGWNIINFECKAGNFRPADVMPGNGDLRPLCMAIETIDLVEQ